MANYQQINKNWRLLHWDRAPPPKGSQSYTKGIPRVYKFLPFGRRKLRGTVHLVEDKAVDRLGDVLAAFPFLEVNSGEYWVAKDLPCRSQSASKSNLRFVHSSKIFEFIFWERCRGSGDCRWSRWSRWPRGTRGHHGGARNELSYWILWNTF